MPIATGRYESAPGTLADGTTKQLLLDSTGKLVTAAGGTGTSADQVQGNVAAAATDSGNPVKIGGKYNVTLPNYTDGQRGDAQLNARGALRIEVTSGVAVASVNTITSDITTQAGLLIASVTKPITSGGLSLARVVTGTTGVIKASAGQLYTLSVQNTNAAVRYLHLYNKATAPTLSTDTPVMTIPLAASSVAHVPLGDIGIAFATGISWAYTTDNVAIPTTAGTSTELMFSAGYK